MTGHDPASGGVASVGAAPVLRYSRGVSPASLVDLTETPLDVLEVDVADPGRRGPLERPARVLVRRAGVPVGVVDAPSGTTWSQIAAEAGEISLAVPERRACAAPGRLPTVTVVITTIARSEDLALTVEDALSQSLPAVRVLVVDNRPTRSGVKGFLERRFGADVGYVPAFLPGLARARNAGLRAADSDVVAFTDDDVRLDRDWLRRLVEAFGPGIDCVTGLVMPLHLDTEAQLLMERFGGFAKGFRPRLFDLAEHRDPGPLYPFAVGAFGTGANVAFRVCALRDLGGFDETLGAGRPTRGGEDLDVFLRAVLDSRTIAYEPAALAWHNHETEMKQFRTRVFGYGVGMSAVITKHLMRSPGVRGELVRRAPSALRYLLDGASPKNACRGKSYPRRFVFLELLGVLVGPFAYARVCLHSGESGRGRPSERHGACGQDSVAGAE